MLESDLVVIDTFDDLLKRPNFKPSLSFHPKGERKFGTVIAPYRFLERAQCGIESCHTPHLLGYLITTSDGMETAIGSHCGRKHFGVKFTRERKRVDQAVDRRRRIDTVMTMVQDMPRMISIIESLERDYRELQDLKVRLMGAIGTGVFSALKQRADRDEPVIERAVPMTAAEAEIVFETSNRKANDGLGWPHKQVHVATLEGLHFIKARLKDMLVTNLCQPMRDLSKIKASDIDSMKPRALAETAKWVGQVPLGISKAQEVVAAGRRFFQPDNLEKLKHLGSSAQTVAVMIEDLKSR
ncbi:conserved hypothetical protein [Pseudomonas veronii]|uniref:hypothetical protein n=1 Tax=Pseudomonas veronii TaxID=76761 RepID=UPI001769A5EC|nr:hypothetical protein [Pseudomonas veronii]CAD0264282.1 conserved hypothetical protein [Pseudomonas veronii]